MATRSFRSWFVFSCVLWSTGCFHDWSNAERAATDRDGGMDVVGLVEPRADGAGSTMDQGRADTAGPEVSFEAGSEGSPEVLPEVFPRDLVDRVDLASDRVELPKEAGVEPPDAAVDVPVLMADAGPEVTREVQSPPLDVAVTGPEVGRDVPLAPPGMACAAGSECTTGVCADGVCCDRTCGGCSACKQALTGSPDGTCAAVSSGLDPHASCADETVTQPCGRDGACNGSGACRYASVAVVCRPGTCSGNTLTDPGHCDGAGICAVGAIRTCPNATVCASDGTTCGNKLAPGATCTDGSQCNSGSCVDTPTGDHKICCVGACTMCRGCNPTGLSCVLKVNGAPDATCGANPSSCQAQVCNAAGACQPAAQDTTCGQNLVCKTGVCSQVLLFNDLSAPLPWTDRTVQGWASVPTPMTVSVENGRMVMQDPGEWSSSFVQWSSVLDFRNTALQADMTASATRRSLDFVMWGDAHTNIMAGLQRDEGTAYLLVNLADSQAVRLSATAPTPVAQAQRFLLEIRATGQIRVLVDGALVIETMVPAATFSAMPATMASCLGANAYPGQTFTFDNLWVWRL